MTLNDKTELLRSGFVLLVLGIVSFYVHSNSEKADISINEQLISLNNDIQILKESLENDTEDSFRKEHVEHVNMLQQKINKLHLLEK